MRRLLLFARRPVPCRVKTRLAATLGADRACDLYRAFLADEFARLDRFRAGVRVELRATGDGAFDDPAPPPGVDVVDQGPGDLGARLLRAFDSAFDAGDGPVVVLGADSPLLPDASIEAAFSALEGPGVDLALAPAADGGYVLLGLARKHGAPFREVPWGGPAVLGATLERARAAGLAVRLLEPGYDIDDAGDLARLRADLRDPTARVQAPRTAAWVDAQQEPW